MIYPVVLYLKIQSAGQSLLFSSLAELPASSSIGTGFTATPPSLEKRAGSNLSKDARHSWAQGTESSSTKLGRVLMHGCMTSFLAGQEWTHSVTLSPVHQKQSLLNKGRAGPQEYIPLLLPHEGVRRSPLNVDHSKNERRKEVVHTASRFEEHQCFHKKKTHAREKVSPLIQAWVTFEEIPHASRALWWQSGVYLSV